MGRAAFGDPHAAASYPPPSLVYGLGLGTVPPLPTNAAVVSTSGTVQIEPLPHVELVVDLGAFVLTIDSLEISGGAGGNLDGFRVFTTATSNAVPTIEDGWLLVRLGVLLVLGATMLYRCALGTSLHRTLSETLHRAATTRASSRRPEVERHSRGAKRHASQSSAASCPTRHLSSPLVRNAIKIGRLTSKSESSECLAQPVHLESPGGSRP